MMKAGLGCLRILADLIHFLCLGLRSRTSLAAETLFLRKQLALQSELPICHTSVRIAVTANPTAEWIVGQVTEAFPWDEAPKHLLRDRDRAFGPAYTRRLRAMAIRDHPVAPRSPWQNGQVERLIGSIRRECLDHVVVFGEAHVRQILKTYAAYYNEVRTHLSLGKDAPDFRRSQAAGQIVAIPILGGLHHQCVRV